VSVLQIAERFKRKGNDALKKGPKFYDEAIGYYTQALQAKCNIAENNSIYLSNRSVPLCRHDRTASSSMFLSRDPFLAERQSSCSGRTTAR
jgi:hypothetical protein